ncbi:Flp family type IVb pilin [Streptomyces sp. 8N706]|uniref:Flp family type IVb pilin n=1 Tax=Streptomyces sp. 8N706 TaxID=3457416 RepID=UPI003FD1DBED
MSDLMTKAYVKADVHADHWTKTATTKFRKRYANPWDRGQTAVEYLGIIAVVVLIVGALAGTKIGKTIYKAIGEQINKVTQ